MDGDWILLENSWVRVDEGWRIVETAHHRRQSRRRRGPPLDARATACGGWRRRGLRRKYFFFFIKPPKTYAGLFATSLKGLEILTVWLKGQVAHARLRQSTRAVLRVACRRAARMSPRSRVSGAIARICSLVSPTSSGYQRDRW